MREQGPKFGELEEPDCNVLEGFMPVEFLNYVERPSQPTCEGLHEANVP